MSGTFQVSSSAVAKTIVHYDEAGSYEDRHRKARPRVNSEAEDNLIRDTSLINWQLTAPQIAPHRVQITDTSLTSTFQRRLCESGLHGRIAAKKPLLKETNKKKILTLAKKDEQWTLDRWKSVLWSDESILRFLVPTAVSL
jgi:transposase